MPEKLLPSTPLTRKLRRTATDELVAEHLAQIQTPLPVIKEDQPETFQEPPSAINRLEKLERHNQEEKRLVEILSRLDGDKKARCVIQMAEEHHEKGLDELKKKYNEDKLVMEVKEGLGSRGLEELKRKYESGGNGSFRGRMIFLSEWEFKRTGGAADVTVEEKIGF